MTCFNACFNPHISGILSCIIPCTTRTRKVILNQLTLSPNQLRKRPENFLLRSAHIPLSSSHLLTHYNRQLRDILSHLKVGRNLWIFHWTTESQLPCSNEAYHNHEDRIGCWLDTWLFWKSCDYLTTQVALYNHKSQGGWEDLVPCLEDHPRTCK